MTTMLWVNVLLAAAFIALWAGIPLWLVLKRPDARPQPAAAKLAAAKLAAATPAAATPAAREMPATRVYAAYRRAA
jgi:hypothetical protein